MKMFIVNANQNQAVKNTISFLKARLGDDNVDVIEYGSQEDNNDELANEKHANQLEKILKWLKPDSKKNYDVLLIAGGHGDRIRESYTRSLNSLNSKGLRMLISYFQTNEITFNHILLGACFSAQFQLSFIPLLNPDSGTILAFTSIATSNFCSLAEDIARGEKPDIAPIITNGFEQQMSELVLTTDEDIDDLLKNKLIDDFKPIKDQIEIRAVVSEAENTDEEAIELMKTLQKEKNNALLAMMKVHHDDIMTSKDSLLISAVETTLSLYHENTVYLQNKKPSCLPKDVALASNSPEEINKQLILVKDIVDELHYFSGFVEERSATEILGNYEKFFSASPTQRSSPIMQLDSTDSNESEDSPPFGYS